MKKLFLLTALFVAAAFPSCSKHDNEINDVEPPVLPETTPLAIAFAEGNSLQFDVDETKTVHYTITGGSGNTVVKAEMQTADDAYTVETTPASATEGTIAITAKMPETENCVVVTVSDGSQTVTAKIAVSTKPKPEELAITFAEGNSLEFDTGETKTVHYTITGGSDIPVVKAEMKNPDDAYTVEITPISTTEEAIIITAKTPTDNCVLVTVSDGSQTVTAEIAVSPRSSSQELAIAFAEGNSLEFDVNETKTIHYTITGSSTNNVVKAELQNPDGAYTIETKPILATDGIIRITAQMPETENCVVVTVSNGSQTVTAEIAVSTKPVPEEFAVIFTEGNSLQFNIKETQIVHYTITGGSDNTVVKAKMQTPDDACMVETIPISATEGTIAITVKAPTRTCVIVSVSDGDRSITATIDIVVTLKAFDGRTIAVETPGTLAELLADYDRTTINELTVIGNLNDEDIKTLKYLPNLAVLDMENVNLEELPYQAFSGKMLTSVKLPKRLKTIGEYAFYHCYNLTSITIPDSVTTIKQFAFFDCYHLTNITMGNSVTTIEYAAFNGCRGLTSIAIPDSVISIDCAFDCCYGLTGVYITDMAKWCAIEFLHYQFNGCTPLIYAHNLYLNGELVTDLVIPDGVTSIGESAFAYCTCLTSVTIPGSVTEIGVGTFYKCSNLTSVYCKAIVPPSGAYFGNVSATFSAVLYVPAGCKAAYAAADGWKDFTEIIETQF